MVSSTHHAGAVPLIETARLRLRGHRLDDFQQAAAMWADPEVTRYLGGRPFTKEEVWARLLRYVGHWSWMGFGYWAVEEKATGEFVGEIGFADFKRELDPPLESIPDLGWILAARAHGKGYATEAVRPILDWGDRNLPFTHTVCLVDPENQKSIRVAEKSGYQSPEKITYKSSPTILLTRPRPAA